MKMDSKTKLSLIRISIYTLSLAFPLLLGISLKIHLAKMLPFSLYGYLIAFLMDLCWYDKDKVIN